MRRALLLVALAGCSSPAFEVGAPADVVDASPEVVELVDGGSVDARTDVVDARTDGCHVPDGSGWCSSAVGSCEFDPASGGCWVRAGWLNSVPSCGATGFALMACTANPDPSGEPCLPALLARVQSCGAIP